MSLLQILGLPDDHSVDGAAALVAELLRGHGTACEIYRQDGDVVIEAAWRPFVPDGAHPAAGDIWARLFEGLVAGHRRGLQLRPGSRGTTPTMRWVLTETR